MNIADERLVEQALRGDPEGFTALYDRYNEAVFNYMRYRCDDPAAAEDLTDLVFERVLKALSRFDEQKGPFTAWLFGIARHAVIDWRRRQRLIAWLPWEAFLRRPAVGPQPHEVVERREDRRELAEALRQLSDRERDVLGLKFNARLTNRQIAAITGLGENQVAVILYRAIRRLRKLMSDRQNPAFCLKTEVGHE